MLDDNNVVVLLEKRTDRLGGLDTLLHIQVRRRLVKHVDISLLNSHNSNGKALKLSTREILDPTQLHVLEIEKIDHHLLIVVSTLCLQHLPNDALDSLRDVVHVLRLDDGLDRVFKHAREEVLELRATEVCQDFSPIGRIVELSKVGLQLASKHLESSALSRTVGSHEPQHLPWPRHRHPVQLERIGPIAVSGLLLHILGKVDDLNGAEGALLDANTAPDAELLRNPSDLAGGRDLHAQLAHADHGAELVAFLSALLGLALLVVNDGDTRKLLVLVILLRRHLVC
mmetsp:Transcript_30853/g.75673  ORF Transcript_30853/g.75673 Transcript_30853/m.75673 type:complete len:285 (-) Transcript_30853:192-1046(-)